jgi:hypothetical protein
MKNFSKAILNYYATFNETRFRFQTRIGYSWTNDLATLDFSVYPEFEKELLKCLNDCDGLNVVIKRGQHALKFNLNELSAEITKNIQDKYSLDYLLNTYEQNNPKKQIIAGNEIIQDNSFDKDALSDAYKTYTLSIKKMVTKIITSKQVQLLEEFKAKRDIDSTPRSTFNPSILENEISADFMKFSISAKTPEDFIQSVLQYFKNINKEIIIFDIYDSLHIYLKTVGTSTVFLAFHELVKEKESYPLFLFEVETVPDSEAKTITLKNARQVFMINTPAINFFQYDTVLTTPRAANFSGAKEYINSIGSFFQAHYSYGEDFISKQSFTTLSKDGLPDLRYRVGLQAIAKEDKKILDYTELIALVDSGRGEYFNKLIDDYISGKGENHNSQVFDDCLWGRFCHKHGIRDKVIF